MTRHAAQGNLPIVGLLPVPDCRVPFAEKEPDQETVAAAHAREVASVTEAARRAYERMLWTRQRSLGIGGTFLVLLVAVAVLIGIAGYVPVAAAVGAVGLAIAALCQVPLLVATVAARLAERSRVALEGAIMAEHEGRQQAWRRAKERHDQDAQAEYDRGPRALAVPLDPRSPSFDVVGGSLRGHRALVATIGMSLLLQERPVLLIDVSQGGAGATLQAMAEQARIPAERYTLSDDQSALDLLSGLDARAIVAMLAGAADATREGVDRRSTYEMILADACAILRADVTAARLNDALYVLVNGEALQPQVRYPSVTADEARRLASCYAREVRATILDDLLALKAAIGQLHDTGAAPGRHLSGLVSIQLAYGMSGTYRDLVEALLVQWTEQKIAVHGGYSPAVILVGGSEGRPRPVRRLATACEAHRVPLIRVFPHLTEDAAGLIGTTMVAFMRPGRLIDPERAANLIGTDYKVIEQVSVSTGDSKGTTRGEHNSIGPNGADMGTSRSLSLSTSNGTQVTGVRTREHVVSPQDLLSLGETEMILPLAIAGATLDPSAAQAGPVGAKHAGVGAAGEARAPAHNGLAMLRVDTSIAAVPADRIGDLLTGALLPQGMITPWLPPAAGPPLLR